MLRRMRVTLLLLTMLGCLLLPGGVRALDNGVGAAPAMGWNSWNTFRCNINEALIKEAG
jgi:alpha-galactosidase